MVLEFLEKEYRPFVFDTESWELFRMDGSNRSQWVKIDDPDRRCKIKFYGSIISESEAKALAEAIRKELEEEGLI